MPTHLMGRLFIPTAVILYSAYMIWEQYAGSYRAESRNYALFMGGLAIVLSLVVVVQVLLKREPVADQDEPEEPTDTANLRRMLLLLVGAVAVVLTINWLGYVLTFLGFLLYALWLLEVRKPAQLLLIPIIATAVIHFGLVQALGLPLPAGILRGVI